MRVLPDVAGIDKTFDYLVPDHLGDQVAVGTLVRVELHGRRVGGWVVEVGSRPPEGVALKPLAKVTGLGPTPELVELSAWAAWRWAGRRSALLRTASPPRAVPGRPAPARVRVPGSVGGQRAAGTGPVGDALSGGCAVLRIPPAGDRLELVLGAAALGHALVLTPSVAAADRLAVRLRKGGVTVAAAPGQWARAAAGATVVGARAGAWSPVPGLAAVVVLDEHDEAYQEERAPTWHARDVAVERARRAGVPCALVSPCPSLEALSTGRLVVVPAGTERAGWPVVDVVDRRREDPVRAGLYSARLVELIRDQQRGRCLCVLNRRGRSRLLACAACGELARCQRCRSAMTQPAPGALRCRACGDERPPVCPECGSTTLRNLRVGVSRVREELEALVDEAVGEVTASARVGEGERVLVGTEAVLHQAPAPGRVGLVAFLDLDQELLAPRYRAAEQALALLARGARLLGPRQRGGRLLVHTRLPRHPVVLAALHADPTRVSDDEGPRRRALGFPPATAMAAVSGPAAEAFVTALGGRAAVDVLGPADGCWLVRAPDHPVLCDALAATPRPPGRLRVEVDPLRV